MSQIKEKKTSGGAGPPAGLERTMRGDSWALPGVDLRSGEKRLHPDISQGAEQHYHDSHLNDHIP